MLQPVHSKGFRTLDDPDPMAMFISGSLRDEWKLHIQQGVAAMRDIARRGKLDCESELVCALAFLQTLGLGDRLLSQSVGGSFVGMRVGAEGLTWQADLNFLCYPGLRAELDAAPKPPKLKPKGKK